MISESQVVDLSKSFDRSKTFAEFIAELYSGKMIEIYLGDAYETTTTEQVSTAYPAVFCGKVVGAFKECLIVNALFVHNKSAQFGNLVFINERAIRALSEINGRGILQDMFLRSTDSPTVKKFAEQLVK